MDVFSFLLGSSYSGTSPLLGAMSSTCTVNGEVVQCPGWAGPVGAIMWLFFVAVFLIIIIAQWKVFVKAGKPGWAVLIPFYNIIVMLSIIKKPAWWILLYFVPLVNVIIGLVVTYNLAKVFGKGVGFVFGLIFLPFIFIPILGFGKATYIG